MTPGVQVKYVPLSAAVGVSHVKPVKPMSKAMIMRDYKSDRRGGDTSDAMLISIRGVKGHRHQQDPRMGLAKKNIKITVVRNALARKAFEGTPVGLNEMLTGSSALAYGGLGRRGRPRARRAGRQEFPELELKGAVLDGSSSRARPASRALSKFPTRDEAIAKVVTLMVSPARKLVGAVKGPGSKVAGLVKAIEASSRRARRSRRSG
jgi:large subunit ribosomal protein L10